MHMYIHAYMHTPTQVPTHTLRKHTPQWTMPHFQQRISIQKLTSIEIRRFTLYFAYAQSQTKIHIHVKKSSFTSQPMSSHWFTGHITQWRRSAVVLVIQ